MVKNEMMVQGVDLSGSEQKPPVILQMNDDDFPARFLKDLASSGSPQISSAAIVNASAQPLYQPVQRMLNLALVDLCCTGLGNPRIDPTRIVSAGLVIRRVYRIPGSSPGTYYEEYGTLSGWMRNPAGQSQWVKLTPSQECLDPDPTLRPQLKSGNAEIDQQLAALSLSTANTESTTPAYAAPPAICAALGRTVFYAVIPTASSEVADTAPVLPPIPPADLLSSLPALLRSSQSASQPSPPSPPPLVDYRWMSDEFLNLVYPPPPTTLTPGQPAPVSTNSDAAWFHGFTTALRMLDTVFGVLDPTPDGNPVLDILNQYNVTFSDGSTSQMGAFFQSAKAALLDTDGYSNSSAQPQTLQMPASWDTLSVPDQNTLVAALITASGPRSQALLAPQGRYQDSSRHYKLRMFFRVKGDTPACPLRLVWSQYSDAFQIAPWHATGNRAHPPIPLPDPTSDFVKSAKPNCSFQVPGNLMSAMQGTSLTGLMNGAGGGGGLKLGWICGFNIPLITICAFFVLNIFLSLLNIIFFWLPFIKICIPFPTTADEGPS
ncbi:MAG: hypothetical protein WCA21_07160 [Terracidiphilus sp.]